MKTKKKPQIDLDPPPAGPVEWTVVSRNGVVRKVVSQTAYDAWRKLALPLPFGSYNYYPGKEK